MSAEPIQAATRSGAGLQESGSVVVVDQPGPYVDTPSDVLVDSLEAQYDAGDELDVDMVFELADRLLDAERRLGDHRTE